MANKTVLDFPEVTAPEDADVIYAIRGTSTGRDKRITWANLKQFLAPLAHAVTSTIYGVATATLYGHVRLNAAPISGSPDGVSSGGVYTAIAAEASARSTADSNLHQDIADAVGAEATLRGDADSALQAQITANAADIVKLWAPTSSGEVGVDPATLFEMGGAMMEDGRCVTVYPTAPGGALQVRLLPPYSTTKRFHLRLRLPAYNAELLGATYQLNVFFNSALNNGGLVMFNYDQRMAAGSADVAQFSRVFTFANNGANNWILM